MIFLFLIFLLMMHFQLQTMSLFTGSHKALHYALEGNFYGFKTTVLKHKLLIDHPVIFKDPLLHHTVQSIDDIQSSRLVIAFYKDIGVNLTVKNCSGSTILHKAAQAKNVAAVQEIAQLSDVKTEFYVQDKLGETALSYAYKGMYGDSRLLIPCIATIAALKQHGYQLSQDPLHKSKRLPLALRELWYNDTKLNQAIKKEKQREDAQQKIKDEIKKIIKDFNADDIEVVINNSAGIARASRYDVIKTIEIPEWFETIPHKKPIIIHELAHHLLGHIYNQNELPELNFTYKQILNREDEADDFAIKECPEEFIKVCQYCIDNHFNPGIRSYKQRIDRAKAYLKR